MTSSASEQSDHIRVREEDGFKIFEKDCVDDLEETFYTESYFAMIGFSDAVIQKLDKSTGQPLEMKGGKGQVTMPYRAFLRFFRLQSSNRDETPAKSTSTSSSSNGIYFRLFGNRKPAEDKDESSPVAGTFGENPPTSNQSAPNNGFFQRIGSAFGNVGSMLNAKNTTDEPAKKDERREDESSLVTSSANQQIQEESLTEEPAKMQEAELTVENPLAKMHSTTWMVKIPILNEDSIIPKTDIEKREDAFNQKLREYYAEKKLGVVITGNRYDIGSRSIKLCESIAIGLPTLEISASQLKGTKESKFAKLMSRDD